MSVQWLAVYSHKIGKWPLAPIYIYLQQQPVAVQYTAASLLLVEHLLLQRQQLMYVMQQVNLRSQQCVQQCLRLTSS